jgi:hypothetical protein
MYPLFRFLEMPVFRYYRHFREEFESDVRKGALKLQVLLRGHMLRRKKEDKINGKPLIVLPEKVVLVNSH